MYVDLNATNVQELCRKNKMRYYPEKTNQVICDNTGLSESAVNNFMRGASGKNVGLNTAGLICREYGVSLDAIFDIVPADSAPDPGHDPEKLELQQKLVHAQDLIAIYQRNDKRRSIALYMLAGLVGLALLALIIDLLNPNVGWIRGVIGLSKQLLRL